MVVDHKLYEVLQVPLNATESDIKRAYRRLALQFHPDKNPGNEHQFQQISHAHQILSNTKSRRIYDRYGDFGLYVLSNVKSATLTEFVLNTGRLRCIFVAVFVALLLLVLFPALVAFRVAGLLSWPWTVIFGPLWLFNLTAVLVTSLLAFLSWKAISASQQDQAENYEGDVEGEGEGRERTSMEGGEAEKENRTAFVVAMIILWTIFLVVFLQELLLVLKLDKIVGWSWWLITMPYLLVESIALLWAILSTILLLARWDSVGEGEGEVERGRKGIPFAKTYFVFCELRWRLLRLGGIILLLLKISILTQLSWDLIFIPLYIVLILSLILDYLVDRHQLRRRQLETHPDQEAPSSMAALLIAYIPSTLMTLAILAFAILLHYRLSSDTTAHSLGWMIVFSPLLVIVGILLILLCCCGPIAYSCLPTCSEMQAGASWRSGEFGEGDDEHSSQLSCGQISPLARFGYVYGPFQHRINNTSDESHSPS